MYLENCLKFSEASTNGQNINKRINHSQRAGPNSSGWRKESGQRGIRCNPRTKSGGKKKGEKGTCRGRGEKVKLKLKLKDK
jgi:hypothetical protein